MSEKVYLTLYTLSLIQYSSTAKGFHFSVFLFPFSYFSPEKNGKGGESKDNAISGPVLKFK